MSILETKWYENMNEEAKKEEQKPWKELLYDYSQDTTLHGVRYTTGPPDILRRLIWVILVLAAFCTFIFLFYSQLLYLLTHPTSVAIDVAYEKELTFPAVTVCNQNQFRLTKLQEAGLIDLFEEKYATPIQTPAPLSIGPEKCSPTFSKIRYGCLSTNHSVQHMKEFREVTLKGCKELCQTLESRTCGVVLFLPLHRSCILQPVGPIEENGQGCKPMAIHRRKRCPATIKSFCDFDGSDCYLSQEEEEDNTNWLAVEAHIIQPRQKDHTTSSERGRLLYLPESRSTTDVRAVLSTPYSYTNGICVELFYSTRGAGVATLAISYRGEDYIQKKLINSTWKSSSWSRMFARLPNGFNQILIEGLKPADTFAGLLVDSISIGLCEDFEKDCLSFIGGSGYTGNVNKTDAGPCLPWVDIPQAWFYRFPEHILATGKKCRKPSSTNLRYGTPRKPWCYTTPDTYKACDIPYCTCKGNYFACGDGRCLPKSMLCDGITDCPDGKDERDYCEGKRSVTCDFNNDYLCGYNGSERVHQGTFWSARLEASSLWPDAQGKYLQVETGEVNDPVGFLMSPIIKTSSESCMSFFFKVGDSGSSSQISNKLEVRNTNFPETLSGKLLWWSKDETEGLATVTIAPNSKGSYLIFRGIVTDNLQMVAIGDIKLTDGACSSYSSLPVICPTGTFVCGDNCPTNDKKCDGYIDCFGSVDEEDASCDAKRTANCDFKDNFLCGYIQSSTLTNFKWSRELEVDFMNQSGVSKTMLGYSCAFPFKYKNVNHSKCITDTLHPSAPWCSLEKVYDEQTSHWDYCIGGEQQNLSFPIITVNGELFSSTSGIIQSTRYPNPYPEGERARYEVLLPVGMTIQLFIEDLDIKKSPIYDVLTQTLINCANDYLVTPLDDVEPLGLPIITEDYVMEEASIASPPYPLPGPGKYVKICGTIQQGNKLKLSTRGNRLRLFFISKFKGTNKGFSLRYQSQLVGSAGSLPFILTAGIPAANGDTVNPNSLVVLKSPEVELSSASCLQFTYSVASELKIAIQRITAGVASNTVWYSSMFSGNTWSKAWASLPAGKFNLFFTHHYGFDVKLKTTKERPLSFTTAISNIQILNGECQIPGQGTLECSFEDQDQCGYIDQSVRAGHWTRVNRVGQYFMAAKVKKTVLSNPAILISKEATVDKKTCFVLEYFCYRCDNNDLIISLYLVTSSQETKLVSLPPASNNSIAVRAKDLEPGTFRLKIEVDGIGELYINKVFLKNGNCSTMNTETAFQQPELFEKWSYLSFTSIPSTEEYLHTEFAKSYKGFEPDLSKTNPTVTGILTPNLLNLGNFLDSFSPNKGSFGLNNSLNTSAGQANVLNTSGSGLNTGLNTGSGLTNSPNISSGITSGLNTDSGLTNGVTSGSGLTSVPNTGSGLTNSSNISSGITSGLNTDSGMTNGLTSGSGLTSVPNSGSGLTNGLNISSGMTNGLTSGSGLTSVPNTGSGLTDGLTNRLNISSGLADVLNTVASGLTNIGLTSGLNTSSGPANGLNTSDFSPGNPTTYALWNDPSMYNTTNSTVREITFNYSSPTSYSHLQHEAWVHDNMSTFYSVVGHQTNDIVYKCTWNGKQCKKIKTTITDLGNCITLNSNPEKPLKTRQIGAQFGLSLTLNIEQYEYIRSRTSDSGIKVYINHQGELPQTKDLGFAIRPGVHALVATSLSIYTRLEPPYGHCGKKELPLHGNVNYSRPRCEVECLTTELYNKCNCKQPHMPGPLPVCSLMKYLDCVIHEAYKGLNNSNCTDECIDACETHRHSVDISYSGMSSISIDAVVSNGKAKLKEKYVKATEIAHRVSTTKLQATIAMMKKVTQSLLNFNDVTLQSMDAACYSIGRATVVLVNFFQKDLNAFSAQLEKYKNAFDTKVGYLVPLILHHINVVFPQMSYIVHSKMETARDEIKNSDFVHTLTMIEEYTKLISNATDSAKNSIYAEHMPASLEPRESKLDCNTTLLVLGMSGNVTAVRSSVESGSSDLQQTVIDLEKEISKTKQCFEFYYTVLNTADEYVSKTMKESMRKMDSELAFSYKSVIQAFRTDAEYILRNVTWFEGLWQDYSKNISRKATIASKIQATTVESITTSVTNIINKIEKGAIQPLTAQVKDVITATVKNFVNMLDVITRLNSFYNDLRWENLARNLEIWQVPIADIDTPSILRGTVKRSETWKTWPRSTNLAEMNNASRKKMQEILGVYAGSLKSKLYEATAEMVSAQSFVEQSVTELVKHLDDYEKFLLINEDFILRNLVEMDVYFKVLSYEKVTMQSAYGIFNFLSEIGGYMGLLIGGSCLTICEFLDLFVFNGCKKMKNGCRSSKVKTLEDEPEKNSTSYF